jgi:hypothetical protein
MTILKSYWKQCAWVFAVLGAGLMASAPAAATQVFDPFNTSLGINSNATLLSGTITGRPGVGGFNAEAWTVEVFAFRGECLRLDVLSASAGDLALGVASPSPLVYFRDDDGGIGVNPLVKINAPFTGWYSVNLGSFNAQQNLYSDFTIAIGRYNGGNPNCAGATAPSAAAAASGAKSEHPGGGPAGTTR